MSVRKRGRDGDGLAARGELRLLLEIASTTALRPIELCKLRWRDVALVDRQASREPERP